LLLSSLVSDVFGCFLVVMVNVSEDQIRRVKFIL
jgi:hypothetical protein